MKIFSLIITFIIYNFLFSQNYENVDDSASIKEIIFYNKNIIDHKIFYIDDKISEKVWYDENSKIKLRIVYTYSNGVLIKRTWYNSKAEITGCTMD